MDTVMSLEGNEEAVANNPNLAKSLKEFGVDAIDKVTPAKAPTYKMVGDSKIPVSKSTGTLWKGRQQQGLKNRSSAKEGWDETIRYYNNDQQSHRSENGDNQSGNKLYSKRLNNNHTETENVVFSNCSIMVPMLYAKNPDLAVVDNIDANQPFCDMLERLGDKLMEMKDRPGIALKSKMRKAVLITLLTNSAYIRIGYTKKENSLEEGFAELQKLAEELEKAKDKKKIVEIEGKLQALEEKISMLDRGGPWATVMLPHRIIADPANLDPDPVHGKWMMEYDYLPTTYLEAVYGQKDENGTVKSVYKSTHVLSKTVGEDSNLDETVNNFVAIKEADDDTMAAKQNGFDSKEALRYSSYTKVWYVWDKTTRRILMFEDCNWEWPIWVWDDFLKLPRFFPYFRLWFHESPDDSNPKGEVTYYLDQQDAINEINDEVRRGRAWAKRNVFYNKNAISQEDVEQVLKGDDGTARGIELEEGQSLNDAIMSLTPPALKFPELFNVDSKFAAINRISGLNDAARGGQFKTNTNTSAVNEYSKVMDIRTEERTDLIEDFIGDIMRNILMLCSMNMDIQQVTEIVGADLAANWKEITDPQDLIPTFMNCRVIGGSTAKPTSKELKGIAIELGQILGQFANASPAIVVVMLKMLEQSFKGHFVITDDDWNMIKETMMQALNKAGSGQEGEAGPEQTQQGQGQGDPKAEVANRIANLPPEAQQGLQELIDSGVPPEEALIALEQELQAQQ